MLSTPLQSARFHVAGVGTALGSRQLKNGQLASELHTDKEWIGQRCGIESRSVCAAGETTVSLATAAARMAIAGVERPDLVICATFTPEYALCPSAPSVAHALDLVGVPAFDVNGACAGGVIGLLVALNFLAAGMARRVLLVASDTTTRHLAHDDAHARILFGDGAAALLLTLSRNGGSRLRAWVAGSDGSGAELFHVPGSGAGESMTHGHSTVRMQGPTLYRFAAQRGSEMLLDTCAAAGVSPQDVDLVVVHQANLRIIEALQHRTCIAADRWVVNLQNIGNTGGASVLLALAQVLSARNLHRGSRVLIGAFGAGLTWAAMLIEW